MTTLPEEVTVPIPDEGLEEWLDDDRTAEAALRRLRGTTRKREHLRAQCDEWTNEILAWWSGEDGPLARETERLTGALERYALATRARDGRKTVELPSGTLSSREASEPKIEVLDDKALLEWALEDDELTEALVKTDRKVLVTALRKHVVVHTTEDGDLYVTTPGGELVPGVVASAPAPIPHVTTS